MPSKTDWARLAMAIDGEGFITIIRSNSPYQKKDRPHEYSNYRYNVVVAVTNTDERLMKWLVSTFGQTYSKNKGQKENWKPRCVWSVNGNKNKEIFLLAIMPYFILKREQANAALKFLRLADKRVPEKREELYWETRKLNRRGKLVETNTPNKAFSSYKTISEIALKIESDLTGDSERAESVTTTA